MKNLSADDMKTLELNMLKDISEFCDQSGLRYYLCGGTLLGAVRHQGFIPWDDDMDIAMPRPDYEKFLQTYNHYNQRYEVSGIENNHSWHSTFARVEDKCTVLYEGTLKEKYWKRHVFVDVFPLDGIPDDPIEEKHFMNRQNILGIITNASAFRFHPSRHYSDSKESNVSLRNFARTILKYLAIILFSGVNTQKIIKLVNQNSKRYEYGMTKSVGITVIVWNHHFEQSSTKSFEERIKFKFEDCEFWGPKGYDEYLTKTYGDYMVPPPIQNRVSHHSFEAYLIETQK